MFGKSQYALAAVAIASLPPSPLHAQEAPDPNGDFVARMIEHVATNKTAGTFLYTDANKVSTAYTIEEVMPLDGSVTCVKFSEKSQPDVKNSVCVIGWNAGGRSVAVGSVASPYNQSTRIDPIREAVKDPRAYEITATFTRVLSRDGGLECFRVAAIRFSEPGTIPMPPEPTENGHRKACVPISAP